MRLAVTVVTVVAVGAGLPGCRKAEPGAPVPQAAAPAPAPEKPRAEPTPSSAPAVAPAPSAPVAPPLAAVSSANRQAPPGVRATAPSGSSAAAPSPVASAPPSVSSAPGTLALAPPVIRRRGPVASGPSYETWLETTGAYDVGVPSSLVVELSAKAPFKCNTQYPYKLSLDAASAVTYPSAVAHGMKVDGKHASMVVPFTPTRTGSAIVGGMLSFSTCTPEQCLVEKARVSVAIDVR